MKEYLGNEYITTYILPDGRKIVVTTLNKASPMQIKVFDNSNRLIHYKRNWNAIPYGINRDIIYKGNIRYIFDYNMLSMKTIYNKDQQPISSLEYGKDSKLLFKFVYEYDNKGRPTKTIRYYNGSSKVTNEIKYDSQNRKIYDNGRIEYGKNTITQYVDDEDIVEYIYYLNAKNQIIKSYSPLYNLVDTYKYDNNGRVINHEIYRNDNYCEIITIYSDDKSRTEITKKYKGYGNNKQLKSNRIEHFNADGKLTTIIRDSFIKGEKLVSKFTTEFVYETIYCYY